MAVKMSQNKVNKGKKIEEIIKNCTNNRYVINLGRTRSKTSIPHVIN